MNDHLEKTFLRLAAVVVCLCLLAGGGRAALAEDCFTLDVDILDMDRLNQNDYVAQYLSSPSQGIRVQKAVSGSSELAEAVRLTLMQMDTQTLVFDKDYGYQSNLFDSGVIYLPYGGSRTIPYLVTLYVGDQVYAMPFMQLQPRLQYNSACTYGPRLRDLDISLSDDWLMGTMLDLNNLRATGGETLEICASNAYVIGQAYVAMEGDALSVQLQFASSANVEVHGASLYVITDCASLTGDPAVTGTVAYPVGQWVSVGQAASALLYLPMQLSYDPAGLSGFQYDLSSGYLQGQLALWQQNRSAINVPEAWPETAPEALATPDPFFDPLPEVTAAPVFPEETPVQPEAWPVEGQPTEGQPVEGQPIEAQPLEGQPADWAACSPEVTAAPVF